MTDQERSNIIYDLMMALDLKAHRLYWLSDKELVELAEKCL